jgi:hypothetical protein
MLVFSSSNTSDKKVLIFHCFGLFLEKSFDFSLFLKVYEGMQGCPFIEEASYKLLIETLLCAEDEVIFLELSLFLFSFSLLFHFYRVYR